MLDIGMTTFIGTTVGDDLHSPDHRRGRPPGLDECNSPPLPSKVVLQPSRKREKDMEDDHIEVWVETVRERHVESTEVRYPFFANSLYCST